MAAADASRRPRPVDVVVGVVYAGFTIAVLTLLGPLTAGDPDAASLVLPAPLSGPWWVVALGLLAQGLILIWAGRAPRIALVAVAAVALALACATPGSPTGIANAAVVVMVFLVVTAMPLSRLRLALASAGLSAAAGEAVSGIRTHELEPSAAILTALTQGVAVILLPLLVGLFVRGRRDVREARRDEQQARTGERDALVQAAVARERTAMARELHDIAAHHLSGIALMAAVVDRQIDTAPEEAHRGVQQVRAQSTMVLDDLRRLVGLLRDDTGGERSVETLAAVPELVDHARAHGPIDLQILASDDRALGTGIGPLAQLALYRTVQEALTNAATHAPGTNRVVQIDDRDDSRVEVTVTNSAPSRSVPRSASGGFGLLGMRERADLVGADLRYGPTPEGGWEIRASVPRESPARLPLSPPGEGQTETPEGDA